MKRLSLVLTTLLLSGCIYLTPPTGLRLGDHSQEFANSTGQPGVQEIQFQEYKASDFSILYPSIWGVGAKEQPAGTSAVTRVAIGVRFQDSGSSATGTAAAAAAEGVIVTTVTQNFGSDPTQAEQGLAQLVQGNLMSSYQNFKLVHVAPVTLGGEPGTRLEATGTDDSGIATHLLAESAMHDGKGYILVIFTIEDRFSTYEPLYDAVFQHFAFIPPVCSASGTASPDASASGTAAASAPACVASGTAPASPAASPASGTAPATGTASPKP
ncbi:MAG TPA: hypothetical protein V6D47_18420 [Oscillatoriaceae cyanobacterium]